MDAQQSQKLFQEADALFRSGNPAEAVKILHQLDKAFPNRLDVLFPALLCLEKLGNKNEAVKLADRLVRDFQDPRAQKVRERIAPSSAYAPPGLDDIPTPTAAAVGGIDLDMNPLADLLDDDSPRRSGPPPVPRRTAAQAGRQEMLIFWGIMAGFLLVSSIFFSRILSEFMALSTMAQTGTQPVLSGSFFFYYILFALTFGVVTALPSGWVSLRVFGNLPNDDLVEDMKDIALYTLYCTLCCLVPIAGPIIALVILAKHYELSCGTLFGTVIVWQLANMGFCTVGMIIVFPLGLLWSAMF